jgi:hypothetical protein
MRSKKGFEAERIVFEISAAAYVDVDVKELARATVLGATITRLGATLRAS